MPLLNRDALGVRRRVAGIVLLLLVASTTGVLAAPPNIVFLLTDDLDVRSAATMPRLPILRAIEGTEPATRWPSCAPEAAKTEGYACPEEVVPATSLRWPEWRGLRGERVTYVEHVTGDRELYYGPVGDPYQLRNVFCRATPEFRDQLARATAALATCRAESCRRAEDR